ncbi:hypothetical protein BH18ACI3_BH18ACI3_18110 [soil metagenome]
MCGFPAKFYISLSTTIDVFGNFAKLSLIAENILEYFSLTFVLKVVTPIIEFDPLRYTRYLLMNALSKTWSDNDGFPGKVALKELSSAVYSNTSDGSGFEKINGGGGGAGV